MDDVRGVRKSCFVAVVGRPSTGKSTLLNRICGHNVAIVSPTPQTTRNAVRGILTEPRGQLVFIDTPGFHHSQRAFNLHMRDLVHQTIRDAEIVLYVVDALRPAGTEEQDLAHLVAEHRQSLPVICVVNKTDRATSEQVQTARTSLAQLLPDATVLPISAQTGSGVDELIDALFEAAPEGDMLYPEDVYTDQPPEFRIAEVIREKAIATAREELPHAIFVEVADLEIRPTADDREDQMWIRAFLNVERESQKGIVVGKGGENIKRIRQSAQRELGRLFPYRIHLDLRVKVSANWRHNEAVLRKLIQ
jgi:GTPase